MSRLEARVRELESTSLFTHNMQAERIQKLEEQNKRYKQAIDEICNGDTSLEGLDAERELDKVTDIAYEALKDDTK